MDFEDGWKELALSSFTTSGENARLLRIEAAKRSTAPGISFSSTPSILMGTRRSCFKSCNVASMRIWPPNFANCPQTIMSALLNVAMRPIMVGSIEVPGVTCKSERTDEGGRERWYANARIGPHPCLTYRQDSAPANRYWIAGRVAKRQNGQRDRRRAVGVFALGAKSFRAAGSR